MRFNRRLLRVALVVLGLSLVAFSVGPLIYNEGRLNYTRRTLSPSSTQASCSSCSCVCSSRERQFASRLGQFINDSYAGCGRGDPDLMDEMHKGKFDLLYEELSLQEAVANETMARIQALTKDAEKAKLRFKAEAEKCNVCMLTCELARERAQAKLVEERKLTALWEKRARERGWKESDRVYMHR